MQKCSFTDGMYMDKNYEEIKSSFPTQSNFLHVVFIAATPKTDFLFGVRKRKQR